MAAVCPADGSQVITTINADIDGTKIVDQLNTTRVDNYDPKLLSGGACINTGYIVNYPSDASIIAYIKAALRGRSGTGNNFG